MDYMLDEWDTRSIHNEYWCIPSFHPELGDTACKIPATHANAKANWWLCDMHFNKLRDLTAPHPPKVVMKMTLEELKVIATLCYYANDADRNSVVKLGRLRRRVDEALDKLGYRGGTFYYHLRQLGPDGKFARGYIKIKAADDYDYDS